MLSHLVHRWFLWTLLALLVCGMVWSHQLEKGAEAIPRHLIVALVLFVTALPLELRAMGRVLRQPRPGLLAIGLNVGLVPPLAWLFSRWLPHGLAEGMIIAAVVPCTLASAAVWTRRAGGNDAVALLVTMVTNLACFLVTPAWIFLLLGARVKIAFGEMVFDLALIVVLPIVFAQLLRGLRTVASWATGHQAALGVAAQCGILSIVWVGAVKSGSQLRNLDASSAITIGSWAIMLCGVLVVHLAVLAIGWRLACALRFPRPEAVAVAFAGSQKTLMVGLHVAIQCAPTFGGLAVLPMVAYHVGQLVVDTLIADHWRNSPHSAPNAS